MLHHEISYIKQNGLQHYRQRRRGRGGGDAAAAPRTTTSNGDSHVHSSKSAPAFLASNAHSSASLSSSNADATPTAQFLRDTIILFEFCELRGPRDVCVIERADTQYRLVDKHDCLAVTMRLGGLPDEEIDRLSGFVLSCDMFPNFAAPSSTIPDSERDRLSSFVKSSTAGSNRLDQLSCDSGDDDDSMPVAASDRNPRFDNVKSAQLITSWTLSGGGGIDGGNDDDVWCYLHYFTLPDPFARGSVRTLCFCVVSQSQRQVLDQFTAWRDFFQDRVATLRRAALYAIASPKKHWNHSSSRSSIVASHRRRRSRSQPPLRLQSSTGGGGAYYRTLDYPMLDDERRRFEGVTFPSLACANKALQGNSRVEVPPPTVHMLCGLAAKRSLNAIRERFPWTNSHYN